jgi:membrane protein YqaA with SNARE-associated domain
VIFWKNDLIVSQVVSALKIGRSGEIMQFQAFVGWLQQFSVQYGYLGVFFVSLVGALSLVVPVPDAITVFTLAGLRVGGGWVFDPLLIAAAATVGSGVGQFSGYLLGVGGKKTIAGKYRKNADFLVRVFNRFGPVGIFAFALTPLPDDLMFIPLGIARYNPVKAFVPALAGKFLGSLIIAFGGRFSIGIITDLFGAGSSLLSFLVSAALGVAVAIAMFKVDWTKHFGKLVVK